MNKSHSIAVGILLVLALIATGSASADASFGQPRAESRFDRLAVGYQRHLNQESFSRVSCDRTARNAFDCQGRWKVTANSDENVLTRFTFKARGTVVRRRDATVAKARFVKWETVKGVTEKTSTVTIRSFARGNR